MSRAAQHAHTQRMTMEQSVEISTVERTQLTRCQWSVNHGYQLAAMLHQHLINKSALIATRLTKVAHTLPLMESNDQMISSAVLHTKQSKRVVAVTTATKTNITSHRTIPLYK